MSTGKAAPAKRPAAKPAATSAVPGKKAPASKIMNKAASDETVAKPAAEPQAEKAAGPAIDVSTGARTNTSIGVGASPVGASPVGASPVGASPVGASPVGASPVGASPGVVPPGAHGASPHARRAVAAAMPADVISEAHPAPVEAAKDVDVVDAAEAGAHPPAAAAATEAPATEPDEPAPEAALPPAAAAPPAAAPEAPLTPAEAAPPAAVAPGLQPAPERSAEPERRPMTHADRIPPRLPSKAEIFVEGDHVVYPTHGVGKVEKIAIEEIAGHKLELIHITFEENRMTLRVPVSKARSAGLRKLATRKLFDEALGVLKGRARIKRTMWSRRAQEYEAKINSGDPLAIAEVVRDLHRNAGQPDQSFSERQIYEAAMDRLAAELAALDETDKMTAVIKLGNFLKTV